MTELWFIGKPVSSTKWMVEGVFVTETEASIYAKEDEFIVLAEIGKRFPVNVLDAKKCYYPKRETWEESFLYKLRHGINKSDINTNGDINKVGDDYLLLPRSDSHRCANCGTVGVDKIFYMTEWEMMTGASTDGITYCEECIIRDHMNKSK